MSIACASCSMDSPVAAPKFCPSCGSPFVEKVKERKKPAPSASSSAALPTSTSEAEKTATRGDSGAGRAARGLWREMRRLVIVSSMVLLAGLLIVGVSFWMFSSLDRDVSAALETPPARAQKLRPAQPQAASSWINPVAGVYRMTNQYAKGALTLTIDGQHAKFLLYSDAGGPECSIEGAAAAVRDQAVRYGPDVNRCEVTIRFVEGGARVETNNCNEYCSMRAVGSVDGDYRLAR